MREIVNILLPWSYIDFTGLQNIFLSKFINIWLKKNHNKQGEILTV